MVFEVVLLVVDEFVDCFGIDMVVFVFVGEIEWSVVGFIF